MNYLFGTHPKFQKFSKLMETELEVFALETFVELPCLPGLRLQDKIFFDEGFDLFFGGYFGDVLSDVYERSIELEFVIYQLRKYELHFWIKLSDF